MPITDFFQSGFLLSEQTYAHTQIMYHLSVLFTEKLAFLGAGRGDLFASV